MSSLLRRSNGHWRGWSNGQWRGRSFAACVPSDDASKVQKGRKRVSKDERKEMVLSFVNKYRATNAGKFPTVSEARNQVGGSYYVIRKIVQELEYQSTISSMNTRHDMKLRKVVVKVHVTSKRVKEVPGINEDVKTVAGYNAEHGTSDECSTSERRHISEGGAEGDIHQRPEKPEHGVNERSHSDAVLDLDVPETKSEQYQQSSESDKFSRALSEKQNEELSKKPSVWGNLKTLADGIMKMWSKW
ncbi:hypothetical protein RHSIM_Rhsim10G0138900 [Rhododendron simsii]|uniref:AT3G52170-like helix-turn-helix domain-containing protein n=1 Tax=Rhododendron simsii TaxID=118357 RepID=A0A834LC96_RHOSS|nr:hypothetical protein RHSIM_Rhsim10G0138900 [Rhododendron simsii]